MSKSVFLILFAICFFTDLWSQSVVLQNNYMRNGFSLNGQWNYIVDVYESGFYNYRWTPYDEIENPGAGAFFLNSKPKSKSDLVEFNFDMSPTIYVPGDWNSQHEKLFYYEGTIWYKKSFDLADFDPEKRYFIHFGAVNYRADVYVNGQKLGMHKGGFTPFHYEMTGTVREKDNFVIVRVDNKRAADEVPTLNTDWWNYGGITRDVTIFAVEPTFIDDYNIQLDKENKQLIKGNIRLNGKDKAGQKVLFSIPELNIQKELFTNDDGFVEFEILSKKIDYWSDTHPKLYDIRLETETDAIKDRIGFRQIKTSGPKILLNGEQIFLRGICVHEEHPVRGGRAYSMEDARMLLGWAKELGCNFVRLAHYPHNENMVRLADEIGMLVWEEIPVYWTIQWGNEETYKKAEQQLKEVIHRDKNRASVIIWSMANETPQSPARNTFLSRLVNTTRSMDGTRLISAAMENHGKKGVKNVAVVEDSFSDMVDIVSFNQYYGWYGGEIANLKNLRWEIDINKPVIISEFGAGALQGYHADSLTRWSEEYQEYLYRETLPALRTIPQLAGISPWILADFRSPRRMLSPYQEGWNRKGLISQTGNRKKAFYVLQKFYEELTGQFIEEKEKSK